MLTGPLKNVENTECIRYESPGARVGHAWLNVEASHGTPDATLFGSGMESGILGFLVADVGRGGSDSMSGVIPGINKTSVRWICCPLSTLTHDCGAGEPEGPKVRYKTKSRISWKDEL